MRRIASVLAVVIVAASLTACSTVVNETQNRALCGPFSSGNSSDSVTVSGKLGSEPTVKFPTPLKGTRSEVTLVHGGSGQQLSNPDFARVAASFYIGTDKTALSRLGYTVAKPLLLQAGNTSNTLSRALECRRVGDRFVLTTTVSALFGASAASELGISGSTNVVAVADVLKAFPGKAEGINQLQDGALPAVVTAVDGQPGLVLPPTAQPPSNDRTFVVKAGQGAALRKGQHAVIRVSKFDWGTKATVSDDTNWTQGGADVITVGSSGAPFDKDLAGRTIGSQLMYYYPATSGAEPTVYVVDLLGTIG